MGLLDWIEEKGGIHAMVNMGGSGSRGGGSDFNLLMQMNQERAQKRMERKMAEALGKFTMDWYRAKQAGEITPENTYEMLGEYLARPEYKDVPTDKAWTMVNTINEWEHKVSAEEKAAMEEQMERLFEEQQKGGQFWGEMPEAQQKAYQWGTGWEPQYDRQGGLLNLPPGAEWRDMWPGKTGAYFPTATEREMQKKAMEMGLDLNKEEMMKQGGYGTYHEKPWNEEEERKKKNLSWEYTKKQLDYQQSLEEEEGKETPEEQLEQETQEIMRELRSEKRTYDDGEGNPVLFDQLSSERQYDVINQHLANRRKIKGMIKGEQKLTRIKQTKVVNGKTYHQLEDGTWVEAGK